MISSLHRLREAVILYVGLIWLALASGASGATNAFERGCAALEARQFAEASVLFRESIKDAPSAEAWRNLGLSEWQCERRGESVLAWERALWVHPFDADAAASLRFARRSAQLAQMPLKWWETYSTCLPADAWAWVACASFWLSITLACVLPYILRWRRSAWSQSSAAVGFALFLLAIPGLAGVCTRATMGVIMAPDTPLRQTPTKRSSIFSRLAAGDMARCERIQGDYCLVRTAIGDAGWVERRLILPVASVSSPFPVNSSDKVETLK